MKTKIDAADYHDYYKECSWNPHLFEKLLIYLGYDFGNLRFETDCILTSNIKFIPVGLIDIDIFDASYSINGENVNAYIYSHVNRETNYCHVHKYG